MVLANPTKKRFSKNESCLQEATCIYPHNLTRGLFIQKSTIMSTVFEVKDGLGHK